MKRILFLLISLGIFAIVVVCIIMYKQVPDEAHKFIKAQKEEQRVIAERQVDSLYKNMEIYPIYYGCKSRFVKGDYCAQTGGQYKDIVGRDLRDLYKTVNGSNYHRITDIASTYRVAPEDHFVYNSRGILWNIKAELGIYNSNQGNDKFMVGLHGVNWKGIWQTGWALGVRENWGNGTIVEYIIIPYAISFRKQSYGTLEGYISIDDILDNSYKFYTENDKSNFKNRIVHNIKHFIEPQCIDNNYYYLSELDAKESSRYYTSLIPNYTDYSVYMYNNSYYVYIKGYGTKVYELSLDKEYVKCCKEQYIANKRHSIVVYALIGFSILFILWIVLLSLIVIERKKRRQTILQRIINKCNPKNFVKKYNPEKLRAANDIYGKALLT